MQTTNEVLPPSVNLHFWRPCNMRCGFCFATYEDTAKQLPRGHLPREDLLRLIDTVAAHGARKLTFVGGEPTLCPWLGELIGRAKQHGLTTMLVSNGWRLRDADYMRAELRELDWLTLSVDSLDADKNLRAGRAHRGTEVMRAEDLVLIGERARRMGMRLKLNTVVHAINASDDFACFVAALRPSRWKLFRVLPVEGQNHERFAEFELDRGRFAAYVERHRWLEQLGVTIVAEDNEDMRGTYAMIDPRGCFHDSVEGVYRYSEPILEVGLERAWAQVRFSAERFEQRGGSYDFDVPASALGAREDDEEDDEES